MPSKVVFGAQKVTVARTRVTFCAPKTTLLGTPTHIDDTWTREWSKGPSHQSADAQMLRCSNAQMLRCSNAQTLRCSDAQMLRCSDAQMLKCSDAQMLRCSNAPAQGELKLKASSSSGRAQAQGELKLKASSSSRRV